MVVKSGDLVKVEYTGMLENGEIFDSSQHGGHSHPIQFTVGNHEVIPGFEKNVLGMDIDSEREFTVPPEDAYGPHRDELVREFPRSQIPLDKEPEVGMVLGLMSPDGRQFHATVTKITPENITLDLNHPLAGKRLIFKIQLKDIKTPEDVEAETEESKAAEEKALNGANGNHDHKESSERETEEKKNEEKKE